MDIRLTADPADLRESLGSVRTIADFSKLLGITEGQLKRVTYGRGHAYREFTVKKRNGGFRQLAEPATSLKIVQQKFNQVLSAAYKPRTTTHGYVSNRSIATNAQVHAGRRWVLNIDLKDFFPSIHFGRVRGALQKRPFEFPPNVAAVAAQLCCRDGALPQGAPTSPIISNIVCARLDGELERLAQRLRCKYSRYADDITLSSDDYVMPVELVSSEATSGELVIGPMLLNVITTNGFEINPAKLRLRGRNQRQEVTGLTVNDFPNVRKDYIRRVRAMLYSWRTQGELAAEAMHFQVDSKDRAPHRRPRFRQIVKGNIDFLAMVRGNDDPTYRKLLTEYAALVPGFVVRPENRRKRNHLQSYRDAIWALESFEGEREGTAFELYGFGLVTCAHVVLDKDKNVCTDLLAFQPGRVNAQYAVRIQKIDIDRDLAVLEFDAPPGFVLTPRFGTVLRNQAPIRIAGFPEPNPGMRLWEVHGRIAQYRPHLVRPQYIVDCPIVGGASGAPVFDDLGSVIGVASVGAATFREAARGVTDDGKPIRFGVIPIDSLLALADREVALHAIPHGTENDGSS